MDEIDDLADEISGTFAGFNAQLDAIEDQCRTAAVRMAWLLEQVELWVAEATSDEDS